MVVCICRTALFSPLLHFLQNKIYISSPKNSLRMITKEVISTLYKKYPRRAKSIDSLDVALLFDSVGTLHDIRVDLESGRLVIGSLDDKSIFKTIPLTHIHAIVPFEEWVAIVLHSTIIFLNKMNTKVSVHLRPITPSFTDKVRGLFSKESV